MQEIRKPDWKLTGSLLVIVMLLGLLCMPFDAYAARQRSTSNEPNYDYLRSILDESQKANQSHSSTENYEICFVDKATGLRVGANTNHLVWPVDENDNNARSAFLDNELVVVQGEEALHEQGACAACDELRKKLQLGEVQDIYGVAILPDNAQAISNKDEIQIEIPLKDGQEQSAISAFVCEDGTLASSGALNRQNGYAILPSFASIFGVAYGSEGGNGGGVSGEAGEAKATDTSTSGIVEDAIEYHSKPHAYTPDDDEGEQGEGAHIVETVLIVIVVVLGIAIAILGPKELAGSIKKRTGKHRKQR